MGEKVSTWLKMFTVGHFINIMSMQLNPILCCFFLNIYLQLLIQITTK